MANIPAQLAESLRDRYTLERELGRGGMATVYLAQDVRHKRPVALKVLHPELAASLGPERFQREIELAARLQHPHILTVYDSGDAGGQLWFTMPYVEGESLRDRLRRERQLPVDEALRVATETARALDYAHRHNVVHRDIKPENILLTKEGDTLVADFGIARALGGEAGLTETGMAIGTPAYMSPEQASGERTIDARTDVYSLGAVLYEMLAGEPPYTGPTAQAVIMKRFSEPVPSVRKARHTVPETTDAAIQRALAPIAADRFGSAADFARALASGATVATPTAVPSVPVPPGAAVPTARVPAAGTAPGRRRRLPLVATALGIGFLVGLGVLFAWRRSTGTAEAGAGPKVVAVLPFENLGDSSTAYFADGITDAVRGKLSALPGLRVIASRSSNEYRHSSKDLGVIGRELGASYLLIGRIRTARHADGTSRVEVSPELVDVSQSGAPNTKWQQPFDAALTDVFQVQADIAGRVASALNVALGAGQQRTIAEQPTQSLAAYDAFLKGEAKVTATFDAPSLKAAVAAYEQAVALDSTFAQAWAELSRARSYQYVNFTPDPATAAAAKAAVDRAVALAPGRPATQLALAVYDRLVRAEYGEAAAAAEAGLRVAPDNTDLLVQAAGAMQSVGKWNESLQSLEHARSLDPRSAATFGALARTYLRLRRYPEALTAANQTLVLAPTDIGTLEAKAMVYVAQGDLQGARQVIQSAPADVPPTTLVAAVANIWDLYWVLDDAQQQLVLRLAPSAYDGDRATWAAVLAETYALRGDAAHVRAYADTALGAIDKLLAANPSDAQSLVFRGLMLAYLGRKAEAIQDGMRGAAMKPPTVDQVNGTYMQHQLARIYTIVGEPDKAVDALEPLLKIPYYLSPAWLRIDPNLAPLRGNPRFDRLVAGR